MTLQKGDRVLVTLTRQRLNDTRWTGIIVGESRDSRAWQVIKDGTQWPRGIHKKFCQPESEHGSPDPV